MLEQDKADSHSSHDSARRNISNIPRISRLPSLVIRRIGTLRFIAQATLTYAAIALLFFAVMVYVYIAFTMPTIIRMVMIYGFIVIVGAYVSWMEHRPRIR